MNRQIPVAVALIVMALTLTSCAQYIVICKTTVPPGGAGFPFTWANRAGALPPFTLNDGQCNVKPIGAGQDHTNTFTEAVPPGWMLANITCAYTTSAVSIIGGNPNPAFQPGDNAVAIDINQPNVTCNFVNQLAPPCACGLQTNISTGQGSIDPNWTVNGNPAYTTSTLVNWMSLAPAAWIQPANSASPLQVPNGVYKYQFKFNVISCPLGHIQLGGQFAADNSATAFLNGIPIPGAACSGPNCFHPSGGQAPVLLSVPLVQTGANVLEIDVTNGTPGSGGSSYSGLLVRAYLTRHCP